MVWTALELNGSNYVTIPHNEGLSVFAGPFTVEMWIKLDSFAGEYLTVMAKGATNRLWLSIRPDGRFENYPEIVGTTVVTPGTWYHLAFVADMAQEFLYVNGVLEASVPRTDFVEADGPIALGVAPSLDREFVAGLFDEVSLYDRALTTAEVQAIHAAGASGKCRSSIQNFDEFVLDPQQWRVSYPLNGGNVDVYEGMLRIGVYGDVSNGNVCYTPGTIGTGVGVGLRNRVAGDFDVQVAIRHIGGPFGATRASVQVYQDPDNQWQLSRLNDGGLDGIQTVSRVAGVQLDTPTSIIPSTPGTLRIVRSGSRIDTYFDGTLHTSREGFNGPVIVTLMVQGSRFSSAMLDNFFVRAGTLIDPLLTCPGTPVAVAGTDQTRDEGTWVGLDGTGSLDPEGGSLTYSWTQVAGPPVTLSDATIAIPSFTAPMVPMGGATLTFQLIVHDGMETSSPDTVNITVRNINNRPVALAGDDQAVAEASPVTLDGSNSYDPDGEALSYSWLQITGVPVILSGVDTARPSFVAPLVGQAGALLRFELTVSDGRDQTSDVVDVTVGDLNHDPVADAGLDQTSAEGAIVALDASASSDPDADSLSYHWFQLSGPLVVLSNPDAGGPTFTSPLVGAGGATLTFLLLVDDGNGGFDEDEVAINVQDSNAPPECGLARASLAEIWPPNHKLIAVSILGVTDPENGGVTIEILDVTQDEPIAGLGDGDTGPDAVIQGDRVLLRAERSGTGNGRVYRITFRASDGASGWCTGTATVTVPHSKSKNAPPPVDDGQSYGSTGSY